MSSRSEMDLVYHWAGVSATQRLLGLEKKKEQDKRNLIFLPEDPCHRIAKILYTDGLTLLY